MQTAAPYIAIIVSLVISLGVAIANYNLSWLHIHETTSQMEETNLAEKDKKIRQINLDADEEIRRINLDFERRLKNLGS